MKKWTHCFGAGAVVVTIIMLILTGCSGATAQIQRLPGSAPKHALKGYENCIPCHSAGAGGATKLPANHSYTNDQCRICHDIK